MAHLSPAAEGHIYNSGGWVLDLGRGIDPGVKKSDLTPLHVSFDGNVM